MPNDAESTLPGRWICGVFAEQGKPLCRVGRNPNYEAKLAKLRAGDKSPAK